MIRKLSALASVGATSLVVCASAFGASPSLGYYQCYQTAQTRNALTNAPDGYSTTFATSFWLKANHKYQVSFLTANNTFGQRYSFRRPTLHFVNGAWNDDMAFIHLTGTFYPHGVTMPHSQLKPGRKYTVVLHGRSSDRDTAPPRREFTGSVPRSFWYCKRG